MRVIVFLATISTLFALGSGENAAKLVREDISGDVIRIVKCIQQKLRDGIPEHNIPSLNPLKIDNLELDPDRDIINGHIGFKNLILAGITEFEPNIKADLEIIPSLGVKIEFDLQIPIDLETDYDVDATVFNFLDLYGKGHLKATLNNLGIAGYVHILMKGEEIELEGFSLKISLARSEIKITGLLNDEHMSEIISNSLSDLLPSLFEEHSDDINKIVLKLLMQLAGEIDIENIMEIFGDCLSRLRTQLVETLRSKNLITHPETIFDNISFLKYQ